MIKIVGPKYHDTVRKSFLKTSTEQQMYSKHIYQTYLLYYNKIVLLYPSWSMISVNFFIRLIGILIFLHCKDIYPADTAN